MAIKLKILATLLLLSLTAFSQTGTNKKDTCIINLPCTVANKIAIDLVRGDSALAELKLTQDVLQLERAKVAQQDGIIQSYVIKESAYKEEIALYNEISKKQESIISGLEKDKKRLKIGRKVLGFTVGVLSLATLVEFLVIQSK